MEKNTDAIMNLGEFQITGNYGMERNVEQGVKNLRIAMDEGYPYAKFAVGALQYNGVDVPQNKEQGLMLIKEAATAGVDDAKEFLSNI